MRARRGTTIKLKLSAEAIKLLNAARHRRLGTTLVITTHTGQAKLSRHVTLILG